MKTAIRLLAAASLAVAGSTAFAAPDALSVSKCWIRAMPAGIPSGGFFEVANSSDKPVQLTGVDSEAFGMAMLHQTQSNGSMSKMVMVDTATVPAKGTLSFAPGGYHVMLEEPRQALKIGSTIPLTLSFGDGEKLSAQCKVESPKAMSK
ncbi:copper chaperone PCu(A)C [Burkholderia gladioli]|jgi:copper(I)-binding protein|uniref:copper chaperone PCu(A)C n=1 Tax=Burkholderia gladioli TaxID=28095 RepID=UPI0016401251|nr:copper chaperone PCu(A)C [Burkholderia gladioli]